ncbi:MAG: glutathione S-transferase family protein [Rhodospirillaceae bacterium]
MMKIYGDLGSGNCLKVKWAAEYLKLPYAWIDVDIMAGESRTADFLAMNPAGQVPTVLLDDGRALTQSNAITSYLAEGTPLFPTDPYVRAQINSWLFWEQNSHEFFVAGCRFHMVYLGQNKESRDPLRVERGEQALDHMEQVLDGKSWFVGDHITLADIALVAYTRVADEGGFDLTSRPNVRAWIARCEQMLGLNT